jgi:tight adherence protein C
MIISHAVFLVIVFFAVFFAAILILAQIVPGAVQLRLRHVSNAGQTVPPLAGPQWVQRIVRVTGPLTKLSLPSGDWQHSALRVRFMNAGFRGPAAPTLYFAAKTALTFLLPGLLAACAWAAHVTLKIDFAFAALAAAAAAGYFLPNVVLARLIARRKLEIFINFPDALDLITICVEAGLGLDSAIARVGDEMRLKSQTLSEELHLMTLALRAGGTREQALKDLALRTGVEEVDTLAAMLVQADRFGTSIASSLRVHSESLRSKRRQRAEETAAKMATKMLFPLIGLVFPSMLLVLLGPAVISISKVLLPMLAGNK